MLIAAVVITPTGAGGAMSALASPLLLLAGAGVGILLVGHPVRDRPAGDGTAAAGRVRPDAGAAAVFATLAGAVVLRQIPTVADLAGIALVVAGVALHRAAGHER